TLAAARNFNREALPGHAERYARAEEFLEVARKLWDSWDDEAILADKETGRWGDQELVYPAAHEGARFGGAGARNVPRSPQGHPVLVQAGSSEDGKAFAAAHAEAIFTAQQRLEDAKAFYEDVKRRAREAGRDPDGLLVLPGIVPIIGDTESEARELEAELDRLIVPEYARDQIGRAASRERVRLAGEAARARVRHC